MIKFVPASGAATRMFKKQLAVLINFENVKLDKIKDLADKEMKIVMQLWNFIEIFIDLHSIMN